MKKLTLMVLCSAAILSGCQNSALQARKDEAQKIYILETTRNYGGLIDIYRSQLQQHDSEAVRIKLASLYYLTNNYNSSMFYLSPLLTTSQSAQVFLLYGKNIMNTAHYSDAREENWGDNSVPGKSLTETQKLQKAQYYVEKALSIDKNNGEAYNVLGIIQVRLQQLDKAELSFNQARALFYDEVKVTNNLAMISILQKNYRKAYGYLMQLYSNGNRESVVIHNLLFTIVKLGDYNLARQFCIEQKFSDFPDILINELKQTEPKDMVNHTLLAPDVATVKAQYNDDLVEGSKIKEAAPVLASAAAAPLLVADPAPVSVKTVTVTTPAKVDNEIKLSTSEAVKTESGLWNMKALSLNNEAVAKPVNTSMNTSTNLSTATNTNTRSQVQTPVKAQTPVTVPTAKTNAVPSAAVTGKNTVIDMRVGEHQDYSRVVIETESKGYYTVNKISDQNYTITIHDISLNDKVINRLVNRIKNSDRNFVSVNVSRTGQDTIVIHLVTKNVANVDVSFLTPKGNYKHCFILDFKAR